MTGKKLLLFTILQWLVLAFIKVWFFKTEIFLNSGVQQITFWILVLVVITAAARRLGYITFLEAIIVSGFWLLFNSLFDLLWVSPFVGVGIFYQQQYLGGLGCLFLAVMLFHKKNHIKVRHDLHAQHK